MSIPVFLTSNPCTCAKPGVLMTVWNASEHLWNQGATIQGLQALPKLGMAWIILPLPDPGGTALISGTVE